jgi:hypothetical protein
MRGRVLGGSGEIGLAEIAWATWDFVPHCVPYGHETIAEGVEDAVTLTLVGDFGVDFAQGSHLGRPSLVAHTD